MKRALTIVICLLMLAGVACKKNRVVPPANELHYVPTQCSNPWQRPSSVGGLDTVSIKSWLLENNIAVLKITLSPPRKILVCEACSCPSPRILIVLFNPADIEKAKSLGFYKP